MCFIKNKTLNLSSFIKVLDTLCLTKVKIVLGRSFSFCQVSAAVAWGPHLIFYFNGYRNKMFL